MIGNSLIPLYAFPCRTGTLLSVILALYLIFRKWYSSGISFILFGYYLVMYTYVDLTKMLLLFATICTVLSGISGQNTSSTGSSDLQTTTVIDTTVSTSRPPSNRSCSNHNNDCNACVEYAECSYCETDKKCYNIQSVLVDGDCAMKNSYVKTCKVNFKYMMIAVGVMAGIALLVIMIFCCYCCCKRKGVKLSKDDLKWARQREERKQIAAEKRKERAERTEEIRKKYGLKDSNPYQRFDA